jgi:hypothetical protein
MAELLAETERLLDDMFVGAEAGPAKRVGGKSGADGKAAGPAKQKAAGVGNRPAVKTERRDAFEERAVGGPAKRKAAARWTAEEDALAARMRGEGKTHLEIGAALGRSGYAVVNRMAKHEAVVAAGGAPTTGKSEAFGEEGANSKRAELRGAKELPKSEAFGEEGANSKRASFSGAKGLPKSSDFWEEGVMAEKASFSGGFACPLGYQPEKERNEANYDAPEKEPSAGICDADEGRLAEQTTPRAGICDADEGRLAEQTTPRAGICGEGAGFSRLEDADLRAGLATRFLEALTGGMDALAPCVFYDGAALRDFRTLAAKALELIEER